ncbi:mitochondrial uncoupling protein 4, partial [Arapaima gigas]
MGLISEENSLTVRWPRATKFAVSACAAAAAEIVTFPLDLTKTRLQIQGEAAQGGASRGSSRGMLRIALGIVCEEGPLALWQGATPAIYRHIVYSGVRMVAYEQFRDSVLGRRDDAAFPLWKAMVGGMLAGALGQFMASPMDLVKVQMQMEGRRRLEGKPPRVQGVYHAFVKIVSEGGARALWAGWVPNVQRAALVNLGDLATYDSVKHFLLWNTTLQDNILCHSLASTCSGLIAAVMGTPADVIKTRIMNQPTDTSGRGLLYRSSWDCLVQSVRGEGFMSLYKGFLPTWMRMVNLYSCFLCDPCGRTTDSFFHLAAFASAPGPLVHDFLADVRADPAGIGHLFLL